MKEYTVVVRKEYFYSETVEAETQDEAGKIVLEKVQSETPSTIGPMSDGGNYPEIDCIYG